MKKPNSKPDLDDEDKFIKAIKEGDYEVLKGIDLFNQARKCNEKNFYLIHYLFEHCDITVLKDVINRTKYNKTLQRNKDNLNWLHVATKSTKNEKVIELLIDENLFELDAKDDYKYTAIHYAFINEHLKDKYTENLLKKLIKSPDKLLLEGDDGITPMQLLCDNDHLLKLLSKIFDTEFTKLLMKIDDVKKGIITEFEYTRGKEFWTLLLLTNDKKQLMRYLKKFDYNDLMFISNKNMDKLIRRCSENGLGILTHVKELIHNTDFQSKSLLTKMTGIKADDDDFTFQNSSIFLCLITGRLELIPPLIRYVQFDIVPFAIITCLVCNYFLQKSFISDQDNKTITKCTLFCENFAITVINQIANRDITKNKQYITPYLKKPSIISSNLTILDIAFKAKCEKFLSSPICQETLDIKWRNKNKPYRYIFLSPFCKYIYSLVTFILFLFIFSSVILVNFESEINYMEIIIYTYGLGYTIEEIKQMMINLRRNTSDAYIKDASNLIDIFGIILLIIAFIVRSTINLQMDNILNLKLFVIRCLLSISFIFFAMRLLYFASIFHKFGPKLKMISKMIGKDLLPLIVIFAIFIIPFGVVCQSFLYPNKTNLKNQTREFYFVLGDIFRRATFTIFDVQYTLEEIESTHGHYNIAFDAKGRIAVYFVLLVYIVIVNVMLMNLLIALFSYTVTEIIERSSVSWKASRYNFVQEYIDKSLLPPPLNVFNIMYDVVKLVVNQKTFVCKKKSKDETDCYELLLKSKSTTVTRSISLKQQNHCKEFMPFYIMQAHTIKNNRYKLMETEEDRLYESYVQQKQREEKMDRKMKELSDKIDKILPMSEAIKLKSVEKSTYTLLRPLSRQGKQ